MKTVFLVLTLFLSLILSSCNSTETINDHCAKGYIWIVEKQPNKIDKIVGAECSDGIIIMFDALTVEETMNAWMRWARAKRESGNRVMYIYKE
jgi:hypothetical protein